jgi:hypothetical protein
MKTAEETIREELRALTSKMIDVYKWGVGVLAGMQTAFFFLRKDIYDRMLLSGELQKNQYLPWNRYLIGTVVLIIMAFIFTGFSAFLRQRFYFYAKLLSDKNRCPDALPLPPTPHWITFILVSLYFIFPIIDIAIRMVLHFQIEIR